MTPRRPTALHLHRELAEVWASPPGLRRWLTSTNNTDIGMLFLLVATLFFLIGGILALLIRAQLATPGSAFLTPGAYNQIFTMHGTVMSTSSSPACGRPPTSSRASAWKRCASRPRYASCHVGASCARPWPPAWRHWRWAWAGAAGTTSN